MRRTVFLLLASASLLLASLGIAGGAVAGTAASTTTCSNGVDNTPGLGVICEITIVNHISSSGGSATVTIRECHGAAGDPTAACTEETTELTEPVTVVDQCNDAVNGGGGTLRCSVEVINEFTGVDPDASAVTVNQCVGSGDDIANTCDPFPATTTGATITQCNGSANGGTLVELTCTATGEAAGALSVTINQCNDAANGGGALVICSADISNVALTGATPAPTTAPTAGGAGATPPPTDTLTQRPGDGTTPWLAVLQMGVLLVTVLAVSRAASRRVRRLP